MSEGSVEHAGDQSGLQGLSVVCYAPGEGECPIADEQQHDHGSHPKTRSRTLLMKVCPLLEWLRYTQVHTQVCTSSTEPVCQLQVIPESSSLYASNPEVRHSLNRPSSNASEHKIQQIPGKDFIPGSGGSGLSSAPVEFPVEIYLSFKSSNCQVSGQAQMLISDSYSDHSILVEETLVPNSSLAQCGTSIGTSSDSRFALPGSFPTSSS